MNVAILTGNLVKEPYMTEVRNGVKAAFFTIAVEHIYHDTSTVISKICYIDCVGLGPIAQYAEQFDKGDMLEVMGQISAFLKPNKGGGKHIKWNIQVEQVKNLMRRKENAERPVKATTNEYGEVELDPNDFAGEDPC